MLTGKYKSEKINKVNKILNIIVNITLFLNTILSLFLLIMDGNIFPSIFSVMLNRLKLDLRIFDLEISFDFKYKKIKKKKGGYYE